MSEATPSSQPSSGSRPPAERPRAGRHRTTLWVVAGVVILLGLVFLWRGRAGAPAARRGAGAGRAVPVVADSVRARDFAVHLTALGTVTPLRTVTVRTRVDGQLLGVHFREGQVVTAGALLADLDPQPFEAQLQESQAQLARDSALLDNARIDLARYQRLLELDSVSKQQVDTQEALVRQYEAQVRLDQAAVRSASVQLGYTRITSDFAGRVGLRLVDPGNIVHAADAGGITVITQLQPISVLFTVPQGALPQVLERYQAREPQPVTLYGSDGQTELAAGRVSTIDNQIDPTTGTVKVRAEFPNTDQKLFPNQFVNVKLLLEQVPGATVVAAAAIQRGSVGTFVYVVSRQNTVSVRQVQVGPTEGDFAVVTSGLAPGEMVVVDGVDQLRQGVTVRLLHPTPAPGAPGRQGAGRPGAGGRSGAHGAAGGTGAGSPAPRR